MTNSVNSLSRIFDDMWKSNLDFQAGAHARKLAVQPNLPFLTRKMAVRKQLQKAIMLAISKSIGTDRTLIDLMSGDAAATLPLVKGEVLDSLVLIDDGDSEITRASSHNTIDANDLQSKVTTLKIRLDQSTDPAIIPPVKQVLLAETGLGLDPQWRLPAKFDPNDPNQMRSSHTFATNVDLKQLVTTVFDGQSDRILHLIDMPFVNIRPSVAELKSYVDAQMPTELAHVASWNFIPDTRLFHAKIVRA